MRPARSAVDRLPDVRLEGRDAFAAGKVAEVHGVRLVGGEAVIAAVGICRRHLLPGPTSVCRQVRDGAAARGRVVEVPAGVGDDRRLAAVWADVRELVCGSAWRARYDNPARGC